MASLSSLPKLARWRAILAATVLFAGIFALRLVDDDPTSGVTFLFVLPICLLAVRFGAAAGVGAAVVALLLCGIWEVASHPAASGWSYLIRAVVFVATGALTGLISDRLRSAARGAARDARHFDLAHDLLATVSPDGYFTHLSPSWQQELGWAPEEIMARPITAFVHPEDRRRTEDEARRVLGTRATVSFRNRYRTKDGRWRHMAWAARYDEETGVVYASARDITDRHEAERAAREAQERFSHAFDDSATGMALVDVREGSANRIVEANDALAELLALPRDQLIGRSSIAEFAHPEDVERISVNMGYLIRGEVDVYRDEIRVVRGDGQARWVDITASLLRDADGAPAYRLSQLLDIDDRKQAEQKLRYLADHDPLSGLHNRRRFELDLADELAPRGGRSSRGALLAMDVDGFKGINDTLGHAAGDAAIVAVANVLTGRLRTSDVIARMGGDEFAVLLRRIGREEAVRIASELVDAVGAALADVGDGREGLEGVGLSVGVASFDGEVRDPDDLKRAADQALYAAKAAGGGQARVFQRP